MNEVGEAHVGASRFMGTALVAKDTEVLFNRSFGWANLEWNIANTPTTKFRIGSVTKQFTAAAILLLEERGKLTLEDPISKHVPDAPAAWQDVTVFHLLTHTSGIPSFTGFKEYNTAKLSASTPEKIMAEVRDRPLEFTPGEKFTYSNSGYLLLGYIIERVSGQPYGAFLHENVFTRLGMGDTGVDSNAAIIPRRAAGYVPGGRGLANAPYIDMSVPHAAGALYSTTADLWRWQQGLFGGKLLSPESLAKMITPHKGGYALGVGVQTVDGRKVIAHGGGIEGFNSHLMYFPGEKLTVAVLANVNGPTAAEFAQQLAKLAFNETVTLAAERKEIAIPAERLKDYVGTYQLTPRITIKVRAKDGQLTTQLSGQGELPLFAESPSKFFLKVVDAQIEFVRETGRVASLILYQGGRTQQAPRISDKVEERQAIEVPRATLERYVGTYEVRAGFDLVVTLEEDQLMTQATGQSKLPLYPESETKFFLKAVDAQLEFFKDEAGAVTRAVLYQGGAEIQALRK